MRLRRGKFWFAEGFLITALLSQRNSNCSAYAEQMHGEADAGRSFGGFQVVFDIETEER